MDLFKRLEKEEGRRKKEEGRRKKEEGRRKKEEGRRKYFVHLGLSPSHPLALSPSLLLCYFFLREWSGRSYNGNVAACE
jgi:hypothetical protein